MAAGRAIWVESGAGAKRILGWEKKYMAKKFFSPS